MFYSKFETPGFHQKAEVLEEIKEVQSSFIEEKNFFFNVFNTVQWEIGIWNR